MHHILFSVAGISPAVITETLYGLWDAKNNKHVHGGEVHILTTKLGWERLQAMLGEDGQIACFNRMYETEWEIRPEWIEVVCEDGVELDDLRTSAQNALAGNVIVARVYAWTQREDVILHASLAGGRKTMGFYLAQAMSWFARPLDDLSHVLVEPRFEQDRDFYFPDKDNPEHEGIIDFAPQNFVRLRGALPVFLVGDGESLRSYSELVAISQVYLADVLNPPGLKPSVVLDVDRLVLLVGGLLEVKLSKMSVALFLFVFRHANLARGQSRFEFARSFKYRGMLADCVDEMQVGRKRSLSLLAVALETGVWPEGWRSESEAKLRHKQLQNSFGNLHRDFKHAGIWENAAFQVFQKESACWVDIPESRLRVVGMGY